MAIINEKIDLQKVVPREPPPSDHRRKEEAAASSHDPRTDSELSSQLNLPRSEQNFLRPGIKLIQ